MRQIDVLSRQEDILSELAREKQCILKCYPTQLKSGLEWGDGSYDEDWTLEQYRHRKKSSTRKVHLFM